MARPARFSRTKRGMEPRANPARAGQTSYSTDRRCVKQKRSFFIERKSAHSGVSVSDTGSYVAGTASDVGSAGGGFGAAFLSDGLRTAPFKRKIWRLILVLRRMAKRWAAQIFRRKPQITPDVRMNWCAVKPTSDRRAQVVLMGKVATNMDAVSYRL